MKIFKPIYYKFLKGAHSCYECDYCQRTTEACSDMCVHMERRLNLQPARIFFIKNEDIQGCAV